MSDIHELKTRATQAIESALSVSQRLLSGDELLEDIARTAGKLVAALRNGNKVFFFGNGGSAADAQHLAADFVGRFVIDRPALAALALTVNTSSLTAIANDYGFEHIFSRQLEALARAGDAAVGISTSGNSSNVVQGLVAAKRLGLLTVALTGTPGGKLKLSADVDLCLCAPSGETPRIQECHILIGHVMAELVEQELFHAQSGVSRS
jgi:D-sedoheptulose 7-phosphate isomerase